MNISLPEVKLVAIFCETFLYGVYTVLIIVTLVVIAIRRHHDARPVRMVLLLTTVLMYLLSTSHIVVFFVQVVHTFITDQIGNSNANDVADSAPLNKPLVFIEVINVVLADSILIWRVWIVWGRVVWIPLIPSCLLLGTTATGFLFANSFQRSLMGNSIFQGDTLKFAAPASTCILLTNVLCTGLIAGRVWFMQRRLISSGLQAEKRSYTKVILIVLESGLIYSAAWVTILVLYSTGGNSVYIVFDMIDQLTGIVPTVIVLLVHMNLIVGTEVEKQYTTTLSFRAPPDAQAPTTLSIDSLPGRLPDGGDDAANDLDAIALQFLQTRSPMGLGNSGPDKIRVLA